MSDSTTTPQRHAVVIGGARGIGEAVVRRFLADGYSVTAADRLAPELATLAQSLPNAPLDNCLVDITREDDIARLAAQVKQKFGAVHAAVNTVGVFNERRSLLNTPIESFRAVMDANLTGAFLFTKAMVPLMVAHSSMVHIGSVNGEQAGADLGAYKLAKAGLHMMGRCLALELAEDPRRIRVNIVAPGWVLTPGERAMLTQHGWQGVLDDPHGTDFIPLKRRTEAREIADAVAFLCGPGGSGITGVILPVDCGVLTRG